MRTIQQVAVLGAGTMGSRIAAHFANAGVRVLLLDLVAEGESDRSALARRGLEAARKSRPEAFFTPSAAELVRPGNFDDHLNEAGAADWVVEAVAEQAEIKRDLLLRLQGHRKPGSIVSSNTSGISLTSLAQGFPPEFREHFLGVHFFNPPRLLHLVEVIPTPSTSREVLEFVSHFCDVRLGKGVVRCKDTPNFIGNRMGAFFVSTAYHLMLKEGYSVEEVDVLTGPLIGLPRSATFRLLDIIGLDVWSKVVENVERGADAGTGAWEGRFALPSLMREMIAKGWLGEKAGQGFYRRVGPQKQIEVLDWSTGDYRAPQPVSFPSVEEHGKTPDLGQRLQRLVQADDRAGRFLWRLFCDYLRYAVERIPEIADRVVEIDRAMRWGYAHQLGPFEWWDALGVRAVADRMRGEGTPVPRAIERMLAAGADLFYGFAGSPPALEYWDLRRERYTRLEQRPGVLVLSDVRQSSGTLEHNAGASLLDIGDGVLCVELHGKGGLIGEPQWHMLERGLARAGEGFRALVIASQGEHFAAGNDWKWLLEAIQDQNWQAIETQVQRLQQLCQKVKYALCPVIAAPFHSTGGLGSELLLHASAAQASAELYLAMGYAHIGLIPVAGGWKELLLRTGNPALALEWVLRAQPTASAAAAMEAGWPGITGVSMNPTRVVGDAKAAALQVANEEAPQGGRLAQTGSAPHPAAEESWYELWLETPTAQGLNDRQKNIAATLAGLYTAATRDTWDEQALLDREREAFVALCGTPAVREALEQAPAGKGRRS
jgi:3-hydroxyacyl-CoA dehydrogenase